MSHALFIFAALLASGAAQASLPGMALHCNGVRVESQGGGRVLIEGQTVRLKKFNEHYFEARSETERLTVSFRRDAGGDWQAGYSDRHRISGNCLSLAQSVRAAGLPPHKHAAKRACLTATARKTGASPGSLIVRHLVQDEEGLKIRIVRERETQAWLCRVDASGRVVTVRGTTGSSSIRPDTRPGLPETEPLRPALVRKIPA